MEGKNPPLKGSRSSNTKRRAHHQSKIQSTDMNQNAFENIIASSQVRAAHSPSFIEMGKWPFQKLSAFPEQRFASLTAYSSSISIDGCLCCAGGAGISCVAIHRVSCRSRFLFPIAMTAILQVFRIQINMLYPIFGTLTTGC
jgi:hypothetical protein